MNSLEDSNFNSDRRDREPRSTSSRDQADARTGGQGSPPCSGLFVRSIVDALPVLNPALATLSGRRGLHTARINTMPRDDGRFDLLFFMFKMLAGRTFSDTFAMGTSGNLIAFGGGDAGVLRAPSPCTRVARARRASSVTRKPGSPSMDSSSPFGRRLSTSSGGRSAVTCSCRRSAVTSR